MNRKKQSALRRTKFLHTGAALLLSLAVLLALAACGSEQAPSSGSSPAEEELSGNASDIDSGVLAEAPAENPPETKEVDLADRVSWFPVGVLQPNNWDGIQAAAEAWGLRTSEHTYGTSTVYQIFYRSGNSADVVIMEPTGTLSVVQADDTSLDWDRIREYPAENPCVERFALYEQSGVTVALGQISLDGCDTPALFTISQPGYQDGYQLILTSPDYTQYLMEHSTDVRVEPYASFDEVLASANIDRVEIIK